MKTRLLLPVVAVLLMVGGLTGCGDFIHGKEVASDAMDEFHDRFNAGDFDKIYDTADPDFQKAMARADFLKFIGAVHRKLGNYKTCDSQGWKSNTFNGDTSVDLRYKTTFEKGAGEEDFLFRVSGTRATLRGYHINSTQLITD